MSKGKQGFLSFFCFLAVICSCYFVGSSFSQDPLLFLSSSISAAAIKSPNKKTRCVLRLQDNKATLSSFDPLLTSSQSFFNSYHVDAHATDVYRIFEKNSGSLNFQVQDASGAYSLCSLLVSSKLSTEAGYLEFLRLKTVDEERGLNTKNSLVITSDYADFILKKKGLPAGAYDSLLDTTIPVRYSSSSSIKDDEWTIFRILDSSSSSLSYLQLLYGKFFFITSTANANQFASDSLAVDFSPSTDDIGDVVRLLDYFSAQIKMQVSFSEYQGCNYSAKSLDAVYSTYSLNKKTDTSGRYFLLIYLALLLPLFFSFLIFSWFLFLKLSKRESFLFLALCAFTSAVVSFSFYLISLFAGNSASLFFLFNRFGEWADILCVFALFLLLLLERYFLSFIRRQKYISYFGAAMVHEEINI